MEQNTETRGTIDMDDAIMFSEKKRWLFLGLPWTFTRYIITPSLLTVKQGLFNIEENDCYMYKIQDVKLTNSFFERIVGLGTITCYTGDVTNSELKLIHIKHAKEVKSYLLKASEEARLKRRALHTMDIGVHGSDLDGDGSLDLE